MTRLSQIIAVEKGVKADAERALAVAGRELKQAPQLTGIARTYQPRDEDGDQLPPESTNVQIKAEDVITGVSAALTRLMDVTLTKDTANTVARADIKVNGTTLAADVPVTWLLSLEKELVKIQGFISSLPLLDPAEEWSTDDVSGAWRTAPSKTVRSKKVPRNHVVAEATKEHPAQVQTYMEDVPAGDWTTVKFSGALPAARVRQLSGRVAELIRAVRYAREEANATEITDKRAGDTILGWLFAA